MPRFPLYRFPRLTVARSRGSGGTLAFRPLLWGFGANLLPGAAGSIPCPFSASGGCEPWSRALFLGALFLGALFLGALFLGKGWLNASAMLPSGLRKDLPVSMSLSLSF